MNSPRAILGREPAAWVGLIEGVLALLLAFNLGVDQTTFGPIMAAVVAGFGLYTAWATRDTALGAIIGFAKAALTLGAVYGLTLTDGQTGALIALVTVLFGFWQRTQTSPVDAPVDPSPAQVTESPIGMDSTIPGTTLDSEGVSRSAFREGRNERGAASNGILLTVVLVLVGLAALIFIINAL